MRRIERIEGESYIGFATRVTNALTDGQITYTEWCESIIGEPLYSEENIRRCGVFFKKFLELLDREETLSITDDEKLARVIQAKEEIKAERLKLQTTNLEYNAIQRAEARNDMFKEDLIRAINRLEPIKAERPKHDNTYEPQDSTLLITLSDFHAGSTFSVKGLFGETINEYNYNIMWRRLYNLIDQIEADDIDYQDCVVAVLGDCFESILRPSSLLKLREPVIDTVVHFSEDFSQWLVALSEKLACNINVVTIGGNHDVQRLLESRPSFEDENLTKFVVAYVKQRLSNQKEWISVDDYQEIAVKNIRGTSIMFCHGEDKDLSTTMDYFSNLYNIDIDEGYGGHLHRPESKAIGITEVGDRMFTRVGSIVGVDTYSKKIRASARPSVYVALYTDNGKTWSRNYYL